MESVPKGPHPPPPYKIRGVDLSVFQEGVQTGGKQNDVAGDVESME